MFNTQSRGKCDHEDNQNSPTLFFFLPFLPFLHVHGAAVVNRASGAAVAAAAATVGSGAFSRQGTQM